MRYELRRCSPSSPTPAASRGRLFNTFRSPTPHFYGFNSSHPLPQASSPRYSYSYGAHMRTFAVLPCTYAPPPPSPPTAAAKAARARVLPASDPINAKNGRGYTKLWLAADRGEQAEVARLLGARADPNIPGIDGNTPVLIAAYKGHLACVKLLVAGGGDLTIAAKDGRTPLSRAEEEGHPETAAWIRGQGVSH